MANEDNESEATVEAAATLADRNHTHRVSQFSNSSSNGSSAGSTIIIHNNKDKWTTSVEIERNDSGLGSETGKSGGKRPVKIRDRLNKGVLSSHECICEDCDQPFATNEIASKR